MSPFDFFRLYRDEHRGRPCPGYSVEVLPEFTRSTAETAEAEGWVVFANLDPSNVDAIIDEQIRHFERLGQNFEWKLHDFDTPPSLKEKLEARGFGCDAPEAFLALTVDAWSANECGPPQVRIEKIGDEAGIRDFVSVEESAWSEHFPTHAARYLRELHTAPDVTSFYCAYVAEEPVAAGRIFFPAGSSFASLWSGSVVPAMRGRGVYSALLARRLSEAKRRGYRFVTVDAEPMSQPILLRKGFQHICWTHPMKRKV